MSSSASLTTMRLSCLISIGTRYSVPFARLGLVTVVMDALLVGGASKADGGALVAPEEYRTAEMRGLQGLMVENGEGSTTRTAEAYRPETPVKTLDRRLSVAPMMQCTDRDDRYLLRLLSRRVLLYTEMVTDAALLHGDPERLLAVDPVEQPADAFDRGEEQPLRGDLGLSVADDPGERLQSVPFDGSLAGNDRGRRADYRSLATIHFAGQVPVDYIVAHGFGNLPKTQIDHVRNVVLPTMAEELPILPAEVAPWITTTLPWSSW